MARPRTPTNVLEMRGAYAKDPKRKLARANEPEPNGDIGDPPDALSGEAKKCWHEILEITVPGVLVKSDRMTLEIAAELMAAKRELGAEFMAPAQLAMLKSLLAAFGMTPADRSKVSAPKKPAENPFAKLVKKGK